VICRAILAEAPEVPFVVWPGRADGFVVSKNGNVVRRARATYGELLGLGSFVSVYSGAGGITSGNLPVT
jgi:hypothetical protein